MILRRGLPSGVLKRAADTQATQVKKGEIIFIGHGHSLVWHKLKDFIVECLELPYDEFNAAPSAGIANVARLKKMLDDAAFAFLVLTAEDERADGVLQARMNVVHEAGLFQGRLGFEKAIILLEEGCDEFSNIHGLGQSGFRQLLSTRHLRKSPRAGTRADHSAVLGRQAAIPQ